MVSAVSHCCDGSHIPTSVQEVLGHSWRQIEKFVHVRCRFLDMLDNTQIQHVQQHWHQCDIAYHYYTEDIVVLVVRVSYYAAAMHFRTEKFYHIRDRWECNAECAYSNCFGNLTPGHSKDMTLLFDYLLHNRNILLLLVLYATGWWNSCHRLNIFRNHNTPYSS